jgi:hypothetical protein
MVESKKTFYVAIDDGQGLEQVYPVYACSFWHAIDIAFSRYSHICSDRSKYKLHGKNERTLHAAFRRRKAA